MEPKRKRFEAVILDLPKLPVWFKVTGMLQQNWAVVHASEQQQVSIYFFDDHGSVFDILEIKDAATAVWGLRLNGFRPLSEQPEFCDIAGEPSFPLTKGSSTRPVYSSGEYWIHSD